MSEEENQGNDYIMYEEENQHDYNMYEEENQGNNHTHEAENQGNDAMSAKGNYHMAARALQSELINIMHNPIEGFLVRLKDDSNLFTWHINMFGPPDTIYEGAFFRLEMEFPYDYPFAPPKLRFLDPMWHPNVYPNGEVCISILYGPQAAEGDSMSEYECWRPSQSVRSVLISVVSMLNEPNTTSPANPNATKTYMKWLEEGITDYLDTVRDIVQNSKDLAEKRGVSVPETVKDYCAKTTQQYDGFLDCKNSLVDCKVRSARDPDSDSQDPSTTSATLDSDFPDLSSDSDLDSLDLSIDNTAQDLNSDY